MVEIEDVEKQIVVETTIVDHHRTITIVSLVEEVITMIDVRPIETIAIDLLPTIVGEVVLVLDHHLVTLGRVEVQMIIDMGETMDAPRMMIVVVVPAVPTMIDTIGAVVVARIVMTDVGTKLRRVRWD